MSNKNTTAERKRLKGIYLNTKYDTKKRFASYWHQIDEIISLKPEKILEIGVGSGFVSDYLGKKGCNCISLDLLHDLKPNVVGSVLEIPFASGTFNAISCCQVLEHLPYSNFKKALVEIHRIVKKWVVLSLPDATKVFKVLIELPRIKPMKVLIPHPFHTSFAHKFDGDHYWEMGKDGYPLKKIQRDIIQSGFSIIKSYRVFEFYYHRFFVLKKIGA